MEQRDGRTAPALGVGMVGYAFMGAAHSQGWRTVGHVFDLPLRPVPGRDHAAATRSPCGRRPTSTAGPRRRPTGAPWWPATTCTSSTSAHRATAMRRSRSRRWRRASTCCARSRWPIRSPRRRPWSPPPTRPARAGSWRWSASTTGGCPPSPTPMRLIADGRLGALRHVRVGYLQDWLVDPDFPLTWRLRREHAGSGALGDLGAHIVDLAQYLTGEPLVGVSAQLETFVKERPRLDGASSGPTASGDTRRGPVTVDDAAVFTEQARLGRARHVRGDPDGLGAQERPATGGERRVRFARLRPRAPQRAALPRPPG